MTELLKKISFAMLLVIFSVGIATAQKKQKLKKHVCTEACANGKHMYKHGEKGHKCDANCKAMTMAVPELKDHVCTEACHKAGKCVYVHGEKGHKCDANCKKG